ncbi:HDOD domain-containing protein [bacterium]|nr:HDOD domain-containing protein [bacterium]
MSLAKLQKFIQYLRGSNVMAQEDILRAVRQMSLFDRRIGQLSAFRGFIQPDQINTVLLDQSRNGGLFGECSVRLNLMNAQQVSLLLKLQKDDLFLFAQAAVTQKLTTTDKIVGHIKSFLGANPEAAREPDAPPSQEKAGLDRQVRTILKNIEEISPLPATAQRAVVMLDDPEVNLDKIGEILSVDPGLTSTLLRVVNSAFYGLRDKITSVTKALIVLGIKKLRQLIIAAAVMQKFQGVPPQFAQKFWENAVRTAQWSKGVAEFKRMPETDELFVCGLLHNIGHLIMMQYFRPQQEQIIKTSGAGRNILDVERSVIGGTHADLGGFLFNLWQMPKETIQCTMLHHHDLNILVNTPNLSEQVYVVHMASDICSLDPNLDAFAYAEQLDRIGQRYVELLKLGAGFSIDKVSERVDASIGQLMGLFTGR